MKCYEMLFSNFQEDIKDYKDYIEKKNMLISTRSG